MQGQLVLLAPSQVRGAPADDDMHDAPDDDDDADGEDGSQPIPMPSLESCA